MALQLDNRFCEWQGQSDIWDFPNLSNSRQQTRQQSTAEGFGLAGVMRPAYHNAAVLRAAGNDVVVVRTKFNVQDRPRVAAHSGVGHVDAPRLQTQTVTLLILFLLTHVCSPTLHFF